MGSISFRRRPSCSMQIPPPLPLVAGRGAERLRVVSSWLYPMQTDQHENTLRAPTPGARAHGLALDIDLFAQRAPSVRAYSHSLAAAPRRRATCRCVMRRRSLGAAHRAPRSRRCGEEPGTEARSRLEAGELLPRLHEGYSCTQSSACRGVASHAQAGGVDATGVLPMRVPPKASLAAGPGACVRLPDLGGLLRRLPHRHSRSPHPDFRLPCTLAEWGCRAGRGRRL